MADRLAELQRQRALLQEHLAWLEREIAAAKSATLASPFELPTQPAWPIAPAAASFPAVAPATQPAVPVAETPNPDVDALLAEYRTQPDALRQDVRKGCLLYFIGAFALLALVVVGLYFVLRHD